VGLCKRNSVLNVALTLNRPIPSTDGKGGEVREEEEGKEGEEQ